MSISSVSQLHKVYQEKMVEIEKRLAEFRQPKTHEQLFYELCFCILTPGSNGKRCWSAVLELQSENFFQKDMDPSPILRKYTRFFRNKTSYLLSMKSMFPEIASIIDRAQQHALLPHHARSWLISNVNGLGCKEASHFLRNIGVFGNAILDRHILKNMISLKMIKSIPSTLTEKRYYEIEEKLKNFCQEKNLNHDILDLLFWSEETGEVFK